MTGPLHDLAVVGLGAWGASAAWRAAAAGHSVLAFDRHHPPHDQGSHSGTTRLARWSTHQHEDYAPITRRAFELWDDLERDTGAPLVERTGSLLFGPDTPATFRTAIATLDRLGMPYRMLGADELAQHFPGVVAVPGERVLHEPMGNRIRSADAITALLDRARALGADLRPGTTVDRWEADRDHVTVLAGGRAHRARRLILAAGAWSPALVDLDLPLVVERQFLTVFEPVPPREWPCVYFAPLRAGHEGHGYGALETDGRFKLAHHHRGLPTTPGSVRRTVDPDELVDVVAAVRERLPGLDPRPVAATVCLYTNTPDDHFVIDRHPRHPSVVIGAGCNGRGFRYAPAVGEMLVALATADDVPHPMFAVDRRWSR